MIKKKTFIIYFNKILCSFNENKIFFTNIQRFKKKYFIYISNDK